MNLDNSEILFRSHVDQKEVIKHFSSADRKEMSTRNPNYSKNIFRKKEEIEIGSNKGKSTDLP